MANEFGDEGAAALTRMIRKNDSLEELVAREGQYDDTRVSTEGYDRLVSAVCETKSLLRLSLDGQNFVFDHLLRIVKENRSLEIFCVPFCYQIPFSEDNFSSLAFALRSDNHRIML